jgi:hypothetical protein
VGLGARVACVLVLFGSASLARARSLELGESPSLSWIATPASWSQLSTEQSGDWSETIDRAEHPIRLSLEEPPVAPLPRPIRLTLLPPGPPSPPAPEQPAVAPVTSLPPSLEDGDFYQTSPRAIAAPSFRQIRLSLDTGSIGAQGRPFLSAPRPFRLRLDESPLPLSPRPFRNVLE